MWYYGHYIPAYLRATGPQQNRRGKNRVDIQILKDIKERSCRIKS